MLETRSQSVTYRRGLFVEGLEGPGEAATRDLSLVPLA